MRCTTCDYALWNVPAGPCPECGTPFKPSDFRFKLNAIQFRCPRCSQPYYGTDDRGHLVPQAFRCIGCGDALHIDAMLLLPTEGVDERRVGQYRNPWLEEGVGFVPRFLRTALDGALKPEPLIRGTPAESGKGPAVRFVMLLMAAVAMFGVGLVSLVPVFLGGGSAAALGASVVSVLAAFAVPFVLYLLWVLLAHALLRIGSEHKPPFAHTVQAMSYTAGPMLLLAVPCVGPYLLWMAAVPWWITTAIVALRAGTGARVWRCIVGVLVLPTLLIAAGVSGYAGLMYWMMSPTGPIAMARNTAGGTGMTMALNFTISARNPPPGHAAELLLFGHTPAEFVLPTSATNPYALPLGNTDTLSWTALDTTEQRAALDAMIAAMPPGAFAHRFGDFVFVTDALGPGADPNLWRVIASYDPDTNGPGPDPVEIATSAGPVSTGLTGFASELAAQNELRASLGLPPLPDPRQITHAAPATATAGRSGG